MSEFGGDITNKDVSQCFDCSHDHANGTCDAFPAGVPLIILTNEHDHHKPYKNDHGILFEPVSYLTSRQDGGQGSGNFGHKGRPGEVGGSGEGGSSDVKKGLAIATEKKYTSIEKGAEHGTETGGPGDLNNRGTSEKSGAKNRGSDTSGSGEGPAGDIRGSIGAGGRITATYHTESGDVYEFDNPQLYRDKFSELKTDAKYGSCVALHSVENYAKARTFISADGKACFAIKADGNLISVVKDKMSSYEVDHLMDIAVRQGATKLDCFRTKLPEIYSAFGFKEYAHDKWDEQYKPNDWDYDLYKKYQDGRPDVVYMRRGE